MPIARFTQRLPGLVHHCHALGFTLCLLALLPSAAPVLAQGMDVTPMIIAVSTNVTIDTWGRTSTVPKGPGVPESAASAAAAGPLHVGDDARVSVANERWMVEALTANADRATRERFAQSSRELRFRQQFGDMLRRHGADPRDLADVVACYVALSWEVVQGATLNPSQIGGLRRTVHEAVQSRSTLRKLPPAELQSLAERLMYVSIVAVGFSRASAATPAQREETRR
jgi:hypothetical protein